MSSSDVDAGFRSLQFSAGAAVLCGFCGYFAAKQLSKMIVDDAVQHRAMLVGGIGIAGVVLATVYAMFIIYRASMRTKMLAVFALLISLGGSYTGWSVGWKKGGDPQAAVF